MNSVYCIEFLKRFLQFKFYLLSHIIVNTFLIIQKYIISFKVRIKWISWRINKLLLIYLIKKNLMFHLMIFKWKFNFSLISFRFWIGVCRVWAGFGPGWRKIFREVANWLKNGFFSFGTDTTYHRRILSLNHFATRKCPILRGKYIKI